MKVGLGVLRYPPDVFWSMSLREFLYAVEGLIESRGGGKKGKSKGGAPMSRSEFEALAAASPDVPNSRRRSGNTEGARSP